METHQANLQTRDHKRQFSKHQTHEIKIIIVGNVGSGKTTSIQAVSEIPVIGTEARASETEALRRKPTTTVAMEYGIVQMQRTKIHLYGTPGQRRFDFMTTILCKNAAGMILMIDNGHADPLNELDYFLKLHAEFLKGNPALVAVTHFEDNPHAIGLADYHTFAAQKGFTIPVMRVDARTPGVVRQMLMKLLIEIFKIRTVKAL